jgi:hypothetical protein
MYTFEADGTIVYARLCPLTWNDNNMYFHLDIMLYDACPPGLRIIGDTAFTASDHLVRPLNQTELNARARLADQAYYAARNTLISQVRQPAEWGVRDTKRCNIFHMRFNNEIATAKVTWVLGLRLHNFVCRLETINQTRSVFFAHVAENERPN